MRRAATITLVPGRRQMPERLVRSPRAPVRLVLRSRVILLAGDGIENRDIAKKLHLARATMGKWRTRFSEDGFAGIEKDAARPGRRKRHSRAKAAAIVRKTTTETPQGQTHWSRTSSQIQALERTQRHRPGHRCLHAATPASGMARLPAAARPRDAHGDGDPQ